MGAVLLLLERRAPLAARREMSRRAAAWQCAAGAEPQHPAHACSGLMCWAVSHRTLLFMHSSCPVLAWCPHSVQPARLLPTAGNSVRSCTPTTASQTGA
jgi:hypothetical protein